MLDLYAALEIETGTVTHRVSPKHTEADLLRVMKKVARAYPDRDLHVVLDNSSTHNTDEGRAWRGWPQTYGCSFTTRPRGRRG